MAKRDVELVIRAKNEASKAIDSIGTALQDLATAQSGVQRSAAQTDNQIGRLGQALGELFKQFGGMSAVSKVVGELDRAEKAIGRLEGEVAGAVGELDRLSGALSDATSLSAKLAGEMNKATAAVDAQKSSVATAKKLQQEMGAELRKAAGDRDQLTTADTRAVGQIEKLNQKIAQNEARYASLQAQVGATATPTKALVTALERSGQALVTKRAALERLNQGLVQTRTLQAAATSAVTAFESQVAEAASILAGEEATLARLTEHYNAVDVASRNAGRAQKQLEADARAAATALAQQQDTLARARTDLVELNTAADKTDAALQQLATGSTAALRAAFNAQRREMLESKRTWTESTAVVKALAQAMAATDAPTEQMAADFARAKAAAAAAKAEYQTQRAGLQAMGAAMKGAGGDVDSLKAAQERFVAAQNRLVTALAAVRAAAGGTAAELAHAAQEARAAAAAAEQAAAAAARAGAANAGAAGHTMTFAAAIRQFYGESRQAMSWTQRLRGEVLSLVQAYAGLYAVVTFINAVVDAYKRLEAAQGRLLAVFNGNKLMAGQELDYIRRTANRLGIEMGTLADEYSKFASATKGTVLQGEQTRRIFTAVAVAARVNKLDLEQVKGVINALGQIASKGAVQMEELRQQLGDRLPGAVQIMADGLGVTTAELIKMMEAGQVSSAALINFAGELEKRFGSQLPEAMLMTSAAIGQLQNTAFQALLVIGNSGFIERFTALIRDLDAAMKSSAGVSFMQRLGAALGGVSDAVAFAVRHWQDLTTILMAFIGIKIAPFIAAILVGLTGIQAKLVGMPAQLAATTAGLRAMAVSAGMATAAVTTLRTVMISLVTTGGITALLAAIGVLFSFWVTGADKATDAMLAHRTAVDQVKNAYEGTRGAAGKFAEQIKGMSVTQAKLRLAQFTEEVRAARKELGARGLSEYMFDPAVLRQLDDVLAQYDAGKLKAEDLKKAFDQLMQSNAAGVDAGAAAELMRLVDALIETEAKAGEAEQIVKILTGTAEEAEAAFQKLRGAAEGAGGAFAGAATDGARRFENALNDIKALVPELAAEIKKIGQLKELNKLVDAMGPGPLTPEVQSIVDRARAAINAGVGQDVENALEKLTAGQTAAIAVIQDLERFIPTAKVDSDGKYRIGYGSDTVTTSNGSIIRDQAQIKTMVITEADALRDLVRRVKEFEQGTKKQVGTSRYEAFTAEQQAALLSIAYNYGDLPDRIMQAVTSGTATEIADAIRGLKGDNAGINAGRREKEAALFEAPPARRMVTTADTTREINVNIANQELLNQKKNKQLSIEEAIRKAKEADPNITAVEIAQIEELTGRLYDMQHRNEQAQHTEDQINSLLAQRQELYDRLSIYRDRGQLGDYSAAKDDIEKINSELKKVTDEAIKFWQAAGTPEAAAAIAKLRTLQVQLADTTLRAQEAEGGIAAMSTRRAALLERLTAQRDRGDTAGYATTEAELGKINAELAKATQAAIDLWSAAGGPVAAAAVDRLTNFKASLDDTARKAAEAQRQVEQLSTLRGEAMTRLSTANERGDAGAYAAAETEVNKLTGELGKAITAASNLWRATGGPEAETAIARLKTMQVGLADTSRTAQEAEARVQELAQARSQLLEQIAAYEKVGDSASLTRATAELNATNAALTAAIPKAIALWEAVGGKQAEAAIRGLRTVEATSRQSFDQVERAEEKINSLMEIRSQIQQQMELQLSSGNFSGLSASQTALEGINAQLTAAIEKAILMWQAIGGPAADAAIAKLQTMDMTIQATADRSVVNWSEVMDIFGTGLVGAFDQFANAVAEGQSVGEAARDAFMKFASDFLREIAMMIMKQIVFNMLRTAVMAAGVAHGGGIAGSLNHRRTVSADAFAGAMRMHTGGVAGLRANEVPAILKKGEEVLTTSDPRHIFNQGGSTRQSAGGTTNVRVINAIDSASVLDQALQTPAGERVILNWMQANSGAVRQSMG